MNRKFVFDSNCVLKSIFNIEENLDILKDFIEVILDVKIDEIYQREKYEHENVFEKSFGFANVTIVTDENKKINIGIQIVDGLYIQNKMFLHYAQLYSNTVKTITINILDFEYFDTREYHKIIKVRDLSYDGKHFESDVAGELHVLELPKIKDTEINTKEKVWIDYLKNGNLREDIEREYENIAKLDSCLNEYWKSEKL